MRASLVKKKVRLGLDIFSLLYFIVDFEP